MTCRVEVGDVIAAEVNNQSNAEFLSFAVKARFVIASERSIIFSGEKQKRSRCAAGTEVTYCFCCTSAPPLPQFVWESEKGTSSTATIFFSLRLTEIDKIRISIYNQDSIWISRLFFPSEIAYGNNERCICPTVRRYIQSQGSKWDKILSYIFTKLRMPRVGSKGHL